MIVNKNYANILEMGGNGMSGNGISGNGSNMDFAAFSQTEIMQEFIDDLVVDMLNDAGANIEKGA